jgi:GWxTD domain-containing protein
MFVKRAILAALCLMGPARLLWAGRALDLDAAVFRAFDSLGYVEIYAAVQRGSLHYLTVQDSAKAEFKVVLDVLQDGRPALSDTLSALHWADSTQDLASGQFFAHVFRFMMQAGDYDVRGILVQPSGIVDSTHVPLRVEFMPAESLRVSGIELGSKLDFTDEKSILVKNGVRLVPNATRFFGTNMPLFYYYAEAYGLDFDSAAVDSYTVVRRLLDVQTNNPVRPAVTKRHKTIGHSVVLADGFPVTTLRTGTYLLDLEFTSDRTGRHTHAQKTFWMYRQEDFAAGRVLKADTSWKARMQAVEPDFLDIAGADTALGWMKYLLTKEEAARVNRLNLEGKKKFLHDYWVGKEREKPGAANEYFARIVEANRRYTFLKKPGWKTDRGRVYVLYGEPDHVYRNYATADVPDHEQWNYDQLEGGVIFVFFDRAGYGDLDLVHSTKRGEIYNPDWHQLTPFKRRDPGDLR